MAVYLEPKYDSAVSFYKKAYVEREGNLDVLYSYTTRVAEFNTITREPNILGFYSQTTTRHIRDFLYQRGVDVHYSKQKLWEMYTISGKKAVLEKEQERVEKERERAERKAEKEAAKIALKEAKEKRKAEILAELTAELGDTVSKSEIRKLMYKELSYEF